MSKLFRRCLSVSLFTQAGFIMLLLGYTPAFQFNMHLLLEIYIVFLVLEILLCHVAYHPKIINKLKRLAVMPLQHMLANLQLETHPNTTTAVFGYYLEALSHCHGMMMLAIPSFCNAIFAFILIAQFSSQLAMLAVALCLFTAFPAAASLRHSAIAFKYQLSVHDLESSLQAVISNLSHRSALRFDKRGLRKKIMKLVRSNNSSLQARHHFDLILLLQTVVLAAVWHQLRHQYDWQVLMILLFLIHSCWQIYGVMDQLRKIYALQQRLHVSRPKGNTPHENRVDVSYHMELQNGPPQLELLDAVFTNIPINCTLKGYSILESPHTHLLTNLYQVLIGEQRLLGGKLLIDGIPYQNFTPATRRQSSLMLSNTASIIVGKTVHECFAYLGITKPNIIWHALEKVGLLEKIKSWPLQLESPLGHQNAYLSLGELQCLQLAILLTLQRPINFIATPYDALDSAHKTVAEHSLQNCQQTVIIC